MKSMINAIRRMISTRRELRKIKNDQALRERCVKYSVNGNDGADIGYAKSIYKYIKTGQTC